MSYAYTAAAVIALVGSYATYSAQQGAARRQDNALADSLRQQGQLEQQGAQQTNQLIAKTAASNPDAAKSDLLSQFTTELNKTRGNATKSLGQVGNVSGAYTKAANDAAQGISDYGNTNAGLLSSIDAPSVQRQQEAADLSQYATQIGGLKRTSAADEFLTNMRLRSITPNPWLMGLGGVAQGASGAMAARAGYGSGAAASGGTNGGGSVVYGGGYGTNLPFK